MQLWQMAKPQRQVQQNGATSPQKWHFRFLIRFLRFSRIRARSDFSSGRRIVKNHRQIYQWPVPKRRPKRFVEKQTLAQASAGVKEPEPKSNFNLN